MGVRVVAVDDAARRRRARAAEAARARRRIRSASRAPYNSRASSDAAPFDSVPGIGFDSNPDAAAIVPPAGRITGTGPDLAVDPAQNNAFRAINRAWKTAAPRVSASRRRRTGARYVISGLTEAAQDELVQHARARCRARDRPPGDAASPRPRIGLFRPWGSSMDEGWTRWVLEQYGFEFVTLRPADFRAPLAEQGRRRHPRRGRAAADRRRGRRSRRARRRRRAVAACGPSTPTSSAPRTSSGSSSSCARGGTLVCLGGASTFAIQQFKLPVRNVVAGLRPEEFFLRGSIVEVTTDPTHPVMAGMPEKAAVFVDGSPVFETLEGSPAACWRSTRTAARRCLSGYLIGEKYLHGKAAALDVQLDSGHVVLLGFRPQWRGQPFGTLRVLFNSAFIRLPSDSRHAPSRAASPARSFTCGACFDSALL